MMDFFAGMFGGHGESRHSWGHSRHHDQGSTSSDAVKPKPPFIFGSHRN
jgi:hypothetical protein